MHEAVVHVGLLAEVRRLGHVELGVKRVHERVARGLRGLLHHLADLLQERGLGLGLLALLGRVEAVQLGLHRAAERVHGLLHALVLLGDQVLHPVVTHGVAAATAATAGALHDLLELPLDAALHLRLAAHLRLVHLLHLLLQHADHVTHLGQLALQTLLELRANLATSASHRSDKGTSHSLTDVHTALASALVDLAGHVDRRVGLVVRLTLLQLLLRMVGALHPPHLDALLERRHQVPRELQVIRLFLGQGLHHGHVGHLSVSEQLQEAIVVLRHAEERHCLDDDGRQLLLLALGLLLERVVLLRQQAKGSEGLHGYILAAAVTTPVHAEQLAPHLQAVAVAVLDALDVEDKGELGEDVQEGPAHLDDEDVINEADTLRRNEEPQREGEPRDDEEHGCLAELGVTNPEVLLAV